MKWFCSSSLCFNNFRTVGKNKSLTYYRLPRDEGFQKNYQKMFKTDGMNFEKGHICSEHWSGGVRENPEHLPDIIVPKSQLRKLKQKLHNA